MPSIARGRNTTQEKSFDELKRFDGACETDKLLRISYFAGGGELIPDAPDRQDADGVVRIGMANVNTAQNIPIRARR